MEGLNWLQTLLMLFGGGVLIWLFIRLLDIAVVGASCWIDERSGRTRKRREAIKRDMLEHFQNYTFRRSREYDDRHGIEYWSEGSSFHWFHGKYSTEELWNMGTDVYLLSDLFTEEELMKIGS